MTQVLLLNVTYEPLMTIRWRRALQLLRSERAEMIKPVPFRLVRSPGRSVEMPSVIRLKFYVHAPDREAIWSRRAVMLRDNYTCVYCGTKLTVGQATLDHVIPISKCKAQKIVYNTWGNTVCSCEHCQRRKGDRTMSEAGMHFYNLEFEPKRPRVRYLVVGSNIPGEWHEYIRV